MASELKVNKISPESGLTLTLGDSGDTINFGSGVLPNFENLTVTGDLTVDTNSLKVDSTNNFVGIGTASPSVALDVVGAITATGNITGTLATAAQPNITSLGTLTGLTTSGDINLGDNGKINLGASNDLQIFHTGSNSVITDTGTGNLIIRANDLRIQSYALENTYINASEGGSVDLYHNNSLKLATTSTGINVTGTAIGLGNNFASSNPTGGAFSFTDPDGASIQTVARIGNDTLTAGTLVSELEIIAYGSGDNSGGGSVRFINSRFSTETGLIKSSREGFNIGYIDFYTQSSGLKKRMRIASGGDISFYEDTGTTAKFFWDASAERLGIGTSSPSVEVSIAGNDPQLVLWEGTDGASSSKVQLGTGITQGFINIHKGDGTRTLQLNSDGDTYFNGGDVGIGTSSPDKLLHLSAGVGATLRFESTTTGATTGDIFGAIEFETQDSNSPGVKAKIDAYSEGSVGNASLRFFTGDTVSLDEAMRITSSGNIGIGTSSPGGTVHIATTSGAARLVLEAVTTNARRYDIISNSDGLVFRDQNAAQSRMKIDTSGNLIPMTTNAYDLGSSSLVWRNIYTSDFHMSNEGLDKGNDIDGTKGSWTFQEGEENLYLINNKNGKKYKFNLTEVA